MEPKYDWDAGEYLELDRGPLAQLVSGAISDGTLLETLQAAAKQVEPRLDLEDERLPERDESPDGLSVPLMFGCLGDGELQIEVCPAAPTAGWALAWVRHLSEVQVAGEYSVGSGHRSNQRTTGRLPIERARTRASSGSSKRATLARAAVIRPWVGSP